LFKHGLAPFVNENGISPFFKNYVALGVVSSLAGSASQNYAQHKFNRNISSQAKRQPSFFGVVL
jgi:hypothetical protein